MHACVNFQCGIKHIFCQTLNTSVFLTWPLTVGKNCPIPEEIMNVARKTETETYPRLVVPTGVATSQH